MSCNTATREMGYWEEQRREKESKGSIEQPFVAHSHLLLLLYFPFIAAEELWRRIEQNEILFHQGE